MLTPKAISNFFRFLTITHLNLIKEVSGGKPEDPLFRPSFFIDYLNKYPKSCKKLTKLVSEQNKPGPPAGGIPAVYVFQLWEQEEK